jgi:hypothetical protein
VLSLLWVLGQALVAGDHTGPLPLAERRAMASARARPGTETQGDEAQGARPLAEHLSKSKITPRDVAPASKSSSGGQSSLPSVAFSQYMKTARTDVLGRLGCGEGRRLAGSGQDNAIVILAFGRPMRHHRVFGASLFGVAFASTGAVERAAEAYAAGYLRCSPPKAPHLHVAIGTSNFGPGVTYRHGAAWAGMVNSANDWLEDRGLDRRIEFAGANDIELGWNGPGVSRAWVRGYDSAAEWPFYDYGDAAGCPPRGRCIGAWTQEDLWYVAWGARSAWPLPQIYTPTGSMAREWFQLSLYSYRRHGSRMTLAGALAQHMACRQSSDPCRGMNNSPAQAWRQLNRLLNSDLRTAQELRWLSDFRWAVHG